MKQQDWIDRTEDDVRRKCPTTDRVSNNPSDYGEVSLDTLKAVRVELHRLIREMDKGEATMSGVSFTLGRVELAARSLRRMTTEWEAAAEQATVDAVSAERSRRADPAAWEREQARLAQIEQYGAARVSESDA